MRAFNRACEDNGTAFFHSIRDKAIRAICDGNHVKLFEAVHSRLNFIAEDLQGLEGRYSLLWRACDQENPELVGHFLGIEGVSDVSGPDGMTAFALALGHQNISLVEQFLQSNPSPHAKTLARKVLRAASPEQPLKIAIREILGLEGLPHGPAEPVLNSILLENTWKYPLFNDQAEMECEVVREVTNMMMDNLVKDRNRIDTTQLWRFVLGKLCINPGHPERESLSWEVDDITVSPRQYCMCSRGDGSNPNIKLSCNMIQDMIKFLKAFKTEFQISSELLKKLRPSLHLVGSVVEGTRVAIGNELDVMVTFDRWQAKCEHISSGNPVDGPPFKVVEDDAFNLRATSNVKGLMVPYFDEVGRFRYDKFMQHILEATYSSVTAVFEKGNHPERLSRVTENDSLDRVDFDCPECNRARTEARTEKKPFKQCNRCNVVVSQTKIGPCLQLRWRGEDGRKVYCSIDLIPQFNIEPIRDRELTRIVNGGMLECEDPEGSFKYLVGYAETIKFVRNIEETTSARDDKLHFVSLKILNYNKER